MRVFSLATVLLLAIIGAVSAAKNSDPQECEVCYKVLGNVATKLKDKTDMEHVEAEIDKYCDNPNIDRQERKVCYFITTIKRVISQNFKNGVPVNDICKRKLKKQNPEICHVKYGIQVDENTDYSQLKVKQLRALIAEKGLVCNDCVEKSDFIRLLQSQNKKKEL